MPKVEGVSEINHDSVFRFRYLYLPVTGYQIISSKFYLRVCVKLILPSTVYQLSSSTTHSIHQPSYPVKIGYLKTKYPQLWNIGRKFPSELTKRSLSFCICNSKECERRESYDVSIYDRVLDFWQRRRNVDQTFIDQELNEYLAGTTISQHLSLNEDEYSS